MGAGVMGVKGVLLLPPEALRAAAAFVACRRGFDTLRLVGGESSGEGNAASSLTDFLGEGTTSCSTSVPMAERENWCGEAVVTVAAVSLKNA